MENLPQNNRFFCLSLKFGAIASALIAILYSIISLAECGFVISTLPELKTSNDFEGLLLFSLIIVITMAHIVTFTLSAVLLIGVLKEKAKWVQPWVVWVSFITVIYVLVFIFTSTMTLINHFNDGLLLYYLIDFILLVIRIYMLITVASYYKELVTECGDGYNFERIVNRDTWYSSA